MTSTLTSGAQPAPPGVAELRLIRCCRHYVVRQRNRISNMRHLDRGALIVIVITFVLFVIALFAKGVSHDLLLEAGVFLVSVKLIIMAYKASIMNHVPTAPFRNKFSVFTTTPSRVFSLFR